MIIEVMYDMRFFLLILLVSIAAFSDTFLAISMVNTTTLRFTDGFVDSNIYTYRMILGDMSTDFGEHATFIAWFFFCLCTLFNMIIVLNLLIAIISESFGRVNSNS